MNSSLAFPSKFYRKKTGKCSANVDVTPSPYSTDSIMWFEMFISTATRMSKHGNFHGLISGKLMLGYSVNSIYFVFFQITGR